MKKTAFFFLLLAAMPAMAQQKAPAYPLITHDPYFSIWSTTDVLTPRQPGTGQGQVIL